MFFSYRSRARRTAAAVAMFTLSVGSASFLGGCGSDKGTFNGSVAQPTTFAISSLTPSFPTGAAAVPLTVTVVGRNGVAVTGSPFTFAAGHAINVPNLPASGGPYTVTVTASGYPTQTFTVTSANAALGTIYFEPATASFGVTGTPVFPTGATAVPLTVTVKGANGSAVTGSPFTFAAGQAINVPNLSATGGPYTVTIAANGYQTQTFQVSNGTTATLGNVNLIAVPATQTFTILGSATDVNTGAVVPVTVSGVPGGPYTFLNGNISIPNVPVSATPYTITIQGLSNSLNYSPTTVTITRTTPGTVTISADQLMLNGAPLAPGQTPPNPVPAAR